MPYINMTKYPHLRDTIKELIQIHECSGTSFTGYWQFDQEDKGAIVSALILDTPEMDQSELFYDPANKNHLFDNLASFVGNGKSGDLLRRSVIKTVEANYRDLLEEITEQVIEEMEISEREYARNFHTRLNDLVEREMGIR